MLPAWLLKDDFLWQELFKLCLSLLGSLFLAGLIQMIITRRDQKNQEIERKRQQINELRNDFVQVFNEYYKVQKRYTTVRDTLVGKRLRNPYIKDQTAKINEIFDNLLITCIDLEARYATLVDRLKTTFSDFWKNNLAFLMGGEVISIQDSDLYSQFIKYPVEPEQARVSSTLDSFFRVIRYQIEHEQDIDRSIKGGLTGTFHSVLAAFDLYEKQMPLTQVSANTPPRLGAIVKPNRKTSIKPKKADQFNPAKD